MTVRFNFPPTLRLRKRAEFLSLSQEGIKAHQAHFLLIYRNRADGARRFGVTVSRKVGNAVTRNRVKRIVREFCRHAVAVPPADYSIIARKGAGSLGCAALHRELEQVFGQVSQAG